MRRAMIVLCCAALVGCRASAPAPAGPQGAFWAALQRLCGRAYGGRMAVGSAPGDTAFAGKPMVMHVRRCSETEVRVPFHVGDDHSRTWIITRTAAGLRLKHDHRHADGSEDRITQYGGDTRGPGTASTQEFHADAHTATLIPAAVINVWTVEVVPGARFAYALRREGTDRRFRVEFDLTRPVAPPPAPWGYSDGGSGPAAGSAAQPAAPNWIGLGYSVRQQVSALGDFRDVVVDTVAPGSPAEQAGLVKGDVIVAVDGLPGIERVPLFRDAYPGRRYELRVRRAGGAEAGAVLVAAPPVQKQPPAR